MKKLLTISILLLTLTFQAQSIKNIAVGQLDVSDEDGDALTFKIVSGDPDKYFSITQDAVVMVSRKAYATFSRYRMWELKVSISDGVNVIDAIITITLRKTQGGQIVRPNREHIIT